MKAGDFHAALTRMPSTTPLGFTGGAPVVVLSPHPDDESLGVGGLIAAACANGGNVQVVFLTDGAGSHPGSRTFPPERLAALRKAEAQAAGAILGLRPEHMQHLDYPDTAAPTHGPAFEEAVARIVEVVRAARAQVLLVTWGHDPHCDHEAADAMARRVRAAVPGLEVWSYPIWGLHLPSSTDVDTPPPEGVRIDIGPWLDLKRRAIAAHVSQMTDLISDDPTGFRFDEAKLAPFLGSHETLIRMPE